VERKLLLIDAAVNLILGILLLASPARLVAALGLPAVSGEFFRSVLGGVLIGIGLALLQSVRGHPRGLGLDGAIAINLCGAGAVVGWLILAPASVPLRGRVTLWGVSIAVLAIAAVEIRHRSSI
jgi:hypothetical protein